MIQWIKTFINSCWARYAAFRVALIITFMFAIIIIPIVISIYVFSISPILGILIPAFLTVFIIILKKRSREPFFEGNIKELIIGGFNILAPSTLAYSYWLRYPHEPIWTAVFVILATASFLAFIYSAYKYGKHRQDSKF